MKLVIITPSYNARENMHNLCLSIDKQSDPNWQHVIIDDVSDADKKVNHDVITHDSRRELIVNTEKKYALRNVVEVARRFQDEDDVIIGTVDGDDQLTHDAVVQWILTAYQNNPDVDTIWTAHQWDVNEKMNVSQAMPEKINPYEYPWCSSHFRTFKASLLKHVSDDNFKDGKGEWFRRGYDQALMLPLLHVGRRRGYIEEVCYRYNINSVSLPLEYRKGSEVEQVHNIAFIRARGFIT